MRFYGEIQRVSESDDERMVWGYASTDQTASDGLTITIDALRGALADYMAFANIREMHQLSAVGITREAQVDDGGLYIGAWVQDDKAWKKVKTGVYRGFSIGAKVTARDPSDAKRVTGITLNEISLVDRPADPGAVFEVFRAASNEQDDIMKPKVKAADVTTSDELPTPAAAVDRVADADAVESPAAEAPAAEAPEAKTTVEHTEVVDAPSAEPTVEATSTADAPEDPVARAIAAAEAASAGLTAAVETVERTVNPAPQTIAILLPGADIRRGLGMVDYLGYVLQELVYITADSAFEALIEGDNSPVPAQLRTAVAALAQAYKAMSAEELAEMLKGIDIDVSLEVGLIQLAAASGDVARAAGKPIPADTGERIQAAFEGLIARGWTPKAPEPVVDPAVAQRDLLLRTVETMSTQMTEMTARMSKIEAQPMPAKTAGPGATAPTTATIARSIGKGEDVSGVPTDVAPSVDDIQRAMNAMSGEERAMLLTRAALKQPIQITR